VPKSKSGNAPGALKGITRAKRLTTVERSDPGNKPSSAARFVPLSGSGRLAETKSLQASPIENLFQDQLAQTFRARLEELSEDLVRTYGIDEAIRRWDACRPRRPKGRRGAPAGPHNLDDDRALLLMFRQFEASNPSLSPSAAIREFSARNSGTLRQHSPSALAKRIQRMTTRMTKKQN
jgi:hypothetical protein